MPRWRRIAELERQNAKTQELAAGLLSVLAAPAALMLFSPRTWVVWFAWMYVIAVGYELVEAHVPLLAELRHRHRCYANCS